MDAQTTITDPAWTIRKKNLHVETNGKPFSISTTLFDLIGDIESAINSPKLDGKIPDSFHLQGYIRFGGDGAPVIKLDNEIVVKPIPCNPQQASPPTGTPTPTPQPQNTSSTSPPPAVILPPSHTPASPANTPTLANRYRSSPHQPSTPPPPLLIP